MTAFWAWTSIPHLNIGSITCVDSDSSTQLINKSSILLTYFLEPFQVLETLKLLLSNCSLHDALSAFRLRKQRIKFGSHRQ